MWISIFDNRQDCSETLFCLNRIFDLKPTSDLKWTHIIFFVLNVVKIISYFYCSRNFLSQGSLVEKDNLWYNETAYVNSPVSWGCQMYWLHFCNGIRPLCNECPRSDTKLSDGEAPVLYFFRIWSYPFIVITPRSALTWSDSTCWDFIYGLNRIVWPFNCVQAND